MNVVLIEADMVRFVKAFVVIAVATAILVYGLSMLTFLKM